MQFLFLYRLRRPATAGMVAAAVMLLGGGFVYGHEAGDAGNSSAGHSPEGALHFSHPLIAESPSPDTKVRFDYFFRDVDHEGEKAREHTMRLEGEYAFDPAFSVEIDVPYELRHPDEGSNATHSGTVEVGLKFANFAFAEQGLLLGYGIELGLPTGDDEKEIGSDHLFEFEPYFDFGLRRGDVEVVGFVSFGVPTNQADGEEVETELGYNLSALYHVTSRLAGLVELDGESALSGEEDGTSVVNITPGVKFRPFADSNLQVGVGVSFPVSGEREFDVQTILSLFYHF